MTRAEFVNSPHPSDYCSPMWSHVRHPSTSPVSHSSHWALSGRVINAPVKPYVRRCCRTIYTSLKGVFHCAENRDWKLIFSSRGHVLRDWQWCKIDVTDRVFCLEDEHNRRRWRWRIYECSCCSCCVCYDHLISEDVLVITSCTARVRHQRL